MKTTWFAEICVPNFKDTLQEGKCIYAIARIGNTLLIIPGNFIPGNYLNIQSLTDKKLTALYFFLFQGREQLITDLMLKSPWKNTSCDAFTTLQHKQHETRRNISQSDEKITSQRQMQNLQLKQRPLNNSLSHTSNLLFQFPFCQGLQKTSVSQSVPYKDHRVVVFVDGSNLFHAASAMNAHINYRNFLRCIVAQRFLVAAFFYTGFNAAKRKERSFLKKLKCEGYKVIGKELVSRSDGSKKANLDVELALDMVEYAKSGDCDSIVLVSGDGDFTYAVESVKSLGITVDLIALRSMTSRSLIRAANRYVDLEDLRSLMCLNRSSRSKQALPYSKNQRQQYHQTA